MTTRPPVRRPSMADVAKVAGVSHQTVSRVLNDPESVRADTRERVSAAMAQLGYQRNRAARALARSASDVIGVISAGGGRFGPTQALHAVEEAARKAGYVATHVPVSTGGVGQSEHLAALDAQGIVVIAPTTELVDEIMTEWREKPVVLVAAGAKTGPLVSVVAVDQDFGARLAVQHLAELGHRRVHHIAGPEEWLDAASRVIGWRAECEDLGLEPGILVQATWEAKDGYTATEELLDADPDLTAIFAANDQLALGAIRALAAHGKQVPADVSVVGFDDIEGAAYFTPALTTVLQPFDEVGAQAIEVLLGMMAGAPVDRRTLEPQLVVRESAAPPPSVR